MSTMQAGSGVEQKPSESASSEDLTGWLQYFSLRTIAGGAAVFLGAIYAYGAVIKAGQLNDADQSVTDTLPLVPLEQLLVAGINELLPLLAAAFILSMLVIALAERVNAGMGKQKSRETSDGKKDIRSDPTTRRPSPRWAKYFWISAAVLWLIWAAFTASWASLLLFAEITAGSWYAASHWTTPRGNAIFTLMAVSLYFVALAYFAPDPLPRVEMKLSNGSEVHGALIASTGATWYLATGDHRWTAIQSSKMEKVSVEAVEKETPESVYHAITGKDFP